MVNGGLVGGLFAGLVTVELANVVVKKTIDLSETIDPEIKKDLEKIDID